MTKKQWIATSIIAPLAVGITIKLVSPQRVGQLLLAGARGVGRFLATPVTWPLWLLFLVSLPMMGIVLVLLLLLHPRARTAMNDELVDEHDYTRDHFFGFEWRWNYPLGNSGADLIPICPQCQYQLDFHKSYGGPSTCTAVCDNCGFRKTYEGTERELSVRALKSIHHRMRTGEYVDVVRRQRAT